MNLEKNSAKKAKQHTVYKNKDDVRVPGTTTITGVMDKPALVGWANKIGLEGIKVREYVDDLAAIGTLAHYMIECHINSLIQKAEILPDLSDSTPNQISSAENSFLKFLDWEGKNKVEYFASELQLVSEKHQYGGTIDILAKVNDKNTLIDIKTCKGIYNDHHTQVGGGYALLLEEAGYDLHDVRIIRVGRSEEEGTEAEDIQVPKLEAHKKRFLICRELYEINKIVNKK